jgi:hypothetical protein
MFQPWGMHDKCMSIFLYDELVIQGVIHGHNSYMMRQEF